MKRKKRSVAQRWFLVAAGFVIPVLSASMVSAAPIDAETDRARFNYQLYCQGCHGPQGDGRKGVPQIRDSIGLFLQSQAGREYLIKVPGAANSPLDDSQLAAVTNWTIEKFGGSSIPSNWQAYSDAEVAKYRKQPLLEVLRYRQKLLSDITATNN